MQSEDILVVGAGPAGLATSACLRRQGLAHVVLEREGQIANSWHLHYDRLHLHTTKTYSGLPMTPWPRAAPRYSAREQVVQCLQAYAAEHHVEPRLGVAVHAVQRRGDHFIVDTSAGVMTPRIVVMAMGYNGVPKLPSIPAGGYKNAAPYQGKRTLVVGCGNSGAEIALDLAEQGVDVAMVRGPVHVVPRDMFGRPTQHTNLFLSYLPLGLRDAIAMGTIGLVKQGKIRVLSAVHEILPGTDSVRFAGGAQQSFEAIIFATGYTSGLDKVIKGFEAIADACGRPHRFGEESGIPALYFVGFRNPPTGALREIALEAPRVARSIRTAVGGKLARDAA
jgi:cation diffusion facilitator CzcD-associated flavoprotein CzcO